MYRICIRLHITLELSLEIIQSTANEILYDLKFVRYKKEPEISNKISPILTSNIVGIFPIKKTIENIFASLKKYIEYRINFSEILLRLNAIFQSFSRINITINVELIQN